MPRTYRPHSLQPKLLYLPLPFNLHSPLSPFLPPYIDLTLKFTTTATTASHHRHRRRHTPHPSTLPILPVTHPSCTLTLPSTPPHTRHPSSPNEAKTFLYDVVGTHDIPISRELTFVDRVEGQSSVLRPFPPSSLSLPASSLPPVPLSATPLCLAASWAEGKKHIMTFFGFIGENSTTCVRVEEKRGP